MGSSDVGSGETKTTASAPDESTVTGSPPDSPVIGSPPLSCSTSTGCPPPSLSITGGPPLSLSSVKATRLIPSGAGFGAAVVGFTAPVAAGFPAGAGFPSTRMRVSTLHGSLSLRPCLFFASHAALCEQNSTRSLPDAATARPRAPSAAPGFTLSSNVPNNRASAHSFNRAAVPFALARSLYILSSYLS